jgi:hypothetical protein
MSRNAGLVAAWVVAVAAAVVIGVVAVSTVGASIRGRGPLGSEVDRDAAAHPEQAPRKDPTADRVRETFEDEFGSFVVQCRGVSASVVAVRPDESAGWQVVSYDAGPDDDVDAEFSDGRHSVEMEVFCNRGRPTVAELERHTLGGHDD